MVNRGIVLGHVIFVEATEVDKEKVDLIMNLPLPTCVKDIGSSLRHADF